jgi:uncharacterized membrane protein YfcA
LILNEFLNQATLFLGLAAFFAGFVDSIAGGGGLLQVPALFSVFPREIPATLFGINKLSSIGGTFLATTQYLKRVELPKKIMLVSGIFAFIGSFLGAFAVTQISPDFLRKLLPVILFSLLLFTYRQKSFGLIQQAQLEDFNTLFLTAFGSLFIGAYDGFFGPGTGTFFMFLYVKFLGFDFLHGAAATKVANTVTNLAALTLFIPTGHIHWQIALWMMCFNMVGGVCGSRYAMKKGSKFIRVVFLFIVFSVGVKTANDSYHLIDFIR